MTADIFLTSAFGPARSIDLAKVAERAGFGGVWLAEHHFIRYGQCPSATVLAAHLLAATGLRVGTAACVMAGRAPVALAEEVALLLDLAPQRFQLGVARGGPFEGFSPWLDTLLSGLRGDDPVRVAATSLSTVEIAAKRGLPLLLGVENTDASSFHKVQHWSDIAGYESDLHARVMLAHPASSRSEAESVLGRTLPAWLCGIGDPTRDMTAHVSHLLATQAIGTPRDVASALASSPVPHTILMVEAAGSPVATAEAIEALAETVC